MRAGFSNMEVVGDLDELLHWSRDKCEPECGGCIIPSFYIGHLICLIVSVFAILDYDACEYLQVHTFSY